MIHGIQMNDTVRGAVQEKHLCPDPRGNDAVFEILTLVPPLGNRNPAGVRSASDRYGGTYLSQNCAIVPHPLTQMYTAFACWTHKSSVYTYLSFEVLQG